MWGLSGGEGEVGEICLSWGSCASGGSPLLLRLAEHPSPRFWSEAGRDSESNGILDFLKPLPSESEEKISAGRSVETLKPRKGSDWLLETGYAMGVRTGTRHEYPGRKARHSLRDEKVKLQRDGEPLPLLDT